MIAIISDIHDNLANLDKFLKYGKENKIDEIICLGDVASDDTIKRLASDFSGPIHLVRGNMDYFDAIFLKNFANIKYCGQVGKIEIAGKKIAFAHKPDDVDKLTGDYDYVFYGHTHQPWQEKRGQTIFLNPGTVAGTLSKAAFAVWDEKNDIFKLVLLNELR